jgi:hypothetical protein
VAAVACQMSRGCLAAEVAQLVATPLVVEAGRAESRPAAEADAPVRLLEEVGVDHPLLDLRLEVAADARTLTVGGGDAPTLTAVVADRLPFSPAVSAAERRHGHLKEGVRTAEFRPHWAAPLRTLARTPLRT